MKSNFLNGNFLNLPPAVSYGCITTKKQTELRFTQLCLYKDQMKQTVLLFETPLMQFLASLCQHLCLIGFYFFEPALIRSHATLIAVLGPHSAERKHL